MARNGNGRAYCLTHEKFVNLEPDFHGNQHHFIPPNPLGGLVYHEAIRDRDAVTLYSLHRFMCYGTFVYSEPPPNLTEAEWEEIFAQEAMLNGSETIF